MSRFLPAFVFAILLALAGSTVVMAQTATPTPTPDAASYEEAALEQLGNLRIVATDLYLMTGITTDTAQSYLALIRDEVLPFTNDTTPPPDFAAFHVLLFMAVRPCGLSAAYLQQGQTDIFSTVIMSSYIQACYRSVSDASVEWARVTHTAPIFQLRATPAAPATAEPTSSDATPIVTPTDTPAPPVAANDISYQVTLSQTIDGMTVEIQDLEIHDFDSFRKSDPSSADKLLRDSKFTPAAAAILGLVVANHTDKSVQLFPIQSGAVVVAGEQFDLFAYRLLDIGDLDTTYHPNAFKTGKIVFALPQSAWDAIVDGASVAYYIDSSRDYAFEIEPSLP